MVQNDQDQTTVGEGGEILSTSVAARELNVSAQTIRLWERTGKLPARKTTDGRRLFYRSDIEDLKRERASEAHS